MEKNKNHNSFEISLSNIMTNVPNVVRDVFDLYKTSRDTVTKRIMEEIDEVLDRGCNDLRDKSRLDYITILNDTDYLVQWASIEGCEKVQEIVRELFQRNFFNSRKKIDEHTMKTNIPLVVSLGRLPNKHLINRNEGWGNSKDKVPRIEIRKSLDLNILQTYGADYLYICHDTSWDGDQMFGNYSVRPVVENQIENDKSESWDRLNLINWCDDGLPKMIIDVDSLIKYRYMLEFTALRETMDWLKCVHENFVDIYKKSIIDEITISQNLPFIKSRGLWKGDQNIIKSLGSSRSCFFPTNETMFAYLYAEEIYTYMLSILEEDKDVKEQFIAKYNETLNKHEENYTYRVLFSCIKTASIFYGIHDENTEHQLIDDLISNLLKLNDSDVRNSFSLFGGSLRSSSRDFDQRDKPLDKLDFLELDARHVIDDTISLLKILMKSNHDPQKNKNQPYTMRSHNWVNILRNDESSLFGGMSNLDKEITPYNMSDTLFAYVYSLLNLTSIYSDVVGNYELTMSRRHASTDDIWIESNKLIEKSLETIQDKELKDRILSTMNYFKSINQESIYYSKTSFLIEDEREKWLYSNYKQLGRLLKVLLIYSLRQIELMRDEERVYATKDPDKITTIREQFFHNSQAIIKTIDKIRKMMSSEKTSSFDYIGFKGMDLGLVDPNPQILKLVEDESGVLSDIIRVLDKDSKSFGTVNVGDFYNKIDCVDYSIDLSKDPTLLLRRLCSMAHTLTIFEDDTSMNTYDKSVKKGNYTLFDKNRLRTVLLSDDHNSYKNEEPLKKFFSENTIESLEKIEWSKMFKEDNLNYNLILAGESIIQMYKDKFSNNKETWDRVKTVENSFSSAVHTCLKNNKIVRGSSDYV